MTVSAERVREVLEYRDGEMFWVVNKSARGPRGRRAGSTKSDGYRQIRIDGTLYREHRLVFLIHKGYMPAIVDHINGDRSDNRIENLRECSETQSQWNRRTRSTSRTGFKGVKYRKKKNAFIATICAVGDVKYLGMFKDAEAAAKAYDAAAIELHGEFAWTNFPAGNYHPDPPTPDEVTEAYRFKHGECDA